MRVIIAGSREFKDYNKLREECNKILEGLTDIEIVSGNANGADKLGEVYAKEQGYSIKQFLPNWDDYGKKAGIIRNEEMANYADHLIVFWNGISKGTKHMIDVAEKKCLGINVILF